MQNIPVVIRNTSRAVRVIIMAVLLYGCLAVPAVAQDEVFSAGETLPVTDDTNPAGGEHMSADVPESAYTTLLFPTGHLYRQYTADPHRVTVSAQYLAVPKVGIPDAGNNRLDLKVGVHLNIVRVHPAGQPDRGLQVDLLGGFNGQNDLDYSSENIGWDGKYGLTLSVRNRPDLALKFGIVHTSGHVADEYAARTGHSSIDYTREGIQTGVQWFMTGDWLAYFEAGWGVSLGNDALQEPGRLQFGLEFEHDRSAKFGRKGWYAAMNISAWEERDWRVDTTAQGGLAFHANTSVWRIGVQWHNGRPPMSEFFQETETYTLLGFWVDI